MLVPPCKTTAWHTPYVHNITIHFRKNLIIIIIIIIISSSSNIYNLRICTLAYV
jgi:hypothetical protein